MIEGNIAQTKRQKRRQNDDAQNKMQQAEFYLSSGSIKILDLRF